ncbi:MAG TPA: VWA domain-containing protein, partial [Aestuariivirga sp.]|nr:VWA domain-containing protein [Aestuariivirga sp.]
MMLLRWFLAVFLIVTMWALPLRAEEAQRVILVLDASGSMWGQIGGKTKMDIAKEVVGKVVANWKPADELGLVAYGHRKKGACDDIEVLREPGPLDAESYMDAVNGLNPMGKTPMTQAIRIAAEALKFTERKATVILVSDGIETCDPDPCAVAAELEKLGVGLTVHTVGFGLDDKGAVAQLQCLAEKTGGISIVAENADELEKALTKTVETTVETPPEPAVSEFNFTGHVAMAAGVELPRDFNSPAWEFFTSVNGAKGQLVKTEYGADLKTKIETAEDYIAKISNDAAIVEVPFTLVDGKAVTQDVSLEAGVLRLSGKLDETAKLED